MQPNLGPLFLGYADFTQGGIKPANPPREDWEKLAPHKDEDQVRLDVDRSFVYYPKSTFTQDRTRLSPSL